MSRTWVKRMTLALVLCLAAAALASCGRTQGVDRPSGKTALTVGEYKVSEEEYNYYYVNHLKNNGIDAAEAEEDAEYDVSRNAAILDMAKEYGIELSPDERDAVKAEMEQLEETLTREVFEQQLEDFHMTRELYLYLSQMSRLESLLREYVTDERSGVLKYDDSAVLDDIHKNFIAVKQILIAIPDGADYQTRFEALYSRALEASLALKPDGSNFDEVAAEYGDDEQADPVYGRYFTHGMYPEEFEKAAKALSVGEISGVIETEVGYHIIMRIAQDEEYINKNFEQLRYYFLTRCFNEMLDERIDSMEVVRK